MLIEGAERILRNEEGTVSMRVWKDKRTVQWKVETTLACRGVEKNKLDNSDTGV